MPPQSSALPGPAHATLRELIASSPTRLVALLCAVQIVLWTLIPALTSLALPIDVIEGYLWGREWVLATYKHPALPAWVLEISRIVTGQIGWPAYLLSQLFIAATLGLIYLLGRDLMGTHRGAAAALLMTGVFFFSWSSAEFNHNVAQMPFWIGFVWALWRATHGGGTIAWLLLAGFATACVYTKLSCATLLLTGGLWTLWDSRARQTLATPGPWLALGVFLLATAPLLGWLWRNDFLPLQYAERRANSASSVTIPSFLVGQVGRHGGLLLLLSIAGLLGRLGWPLNPSAVNSLPPAKPEDAGGSYARTFLLVMALGPPLAMLVAAYFLGMHLKTAWTASMSTLSGLVAICLTSHRLTSEAFGRLAVAAAIMLFATATAYGLDAVVGSRDEGRYRPQQAAWPADAIAASALDVWAKATPAPLRIVVGETRIAGFAALKAPSLPSLMTEAESWRSPWITPERLRREGALLVWAEPGGMPPDRLRAMAGESPEQHVQIPWPRAPGKPPLQLYIVAVPPKAADKP